MGVYYVAMTGLDMFPSLLTSLPNLSLTDECFWPSLPIEILHDLTSGTPQLLPIARFEVDDYIFVRTRHPDNSTDMEMSVSCGGLTDMRANSEDRVVRDLIVKRPAVPGTRQLKVVWRRTPLSEITSTQWTLNGLKGFLFMDLVWGLIDFFRADRDDASPSDTDDSAEAPGSARSETKSQNVSHVSFCTG